MPSPAEVLAAIRALRNDLLTRKGRNARDKLRNQCDRISTLSVPGEDWASADMQDPLFAGEKGHSVRIVPGEGQTGMVVSLTGKIILGIVTNREDDETVQHELVEITGAKSWKKKAHRYTRR